MDVTSFEVGSIFFILGGLVVVAFAWNRFNQPSFPNQDDLPRALVPLRYLFLESAYPRARVVYVAGFLALFVMLVLPGKAINSVLGGSGIGAKFPTEAWALAVAIFLVHISPNANMKWINFIEEAWRRSVHAWFLVPDGIVKTIGILEGAPYMPPTAQLRTAPARLRRHVNADFGQPSGSLRYRWMRAELLMQMLTEMNNGAASVLKMKDFSPFQEDFRALKTAHASMEDRIKASASNKTHPLTRRVADRDAEDVMVAAVNGHLKNIYRYISWGILYSADSDRQVEDTLRDIGFSVPVRGDRRLFDIVAPPVAGVVVVATAFWLIVGALTPGAYAPGSGADRLAGIVSRALMSGVSAGVMYGGAVFIALNRRAAQIDQRNWQEGAPRCLAPIALWSGALTWAVIVVTTLTMPLAVNWLLVGGAYPGVSVVDRVLVSLYELGFEAAEAIPWFITGATVSVILANLVGRDVREQGQLRRLRDALVLGLGLGLAAAFAQLTQTSLSIALVDLFGSILPWLEAPPGGTDWLVFMPIEVGAAGLVCGAIIGYLAPHACRENLAAPPDWEMAGGLATLTARAVKVFGSEAAAKDWVFAPQAQLGGITPAEAWRYQGHVATVERLLEAARPDPPVRPEDERSGPPAPRLIQGGRGAGG
jgi:hypothetical protein